MKIIITGLTLSAATLLAAGPLQAQDSGNIVEAAKSDLAVYAGPQTDWRGPSSSPHPEAGKKIVYVSNDENNDAAHAWGEAIKEAGAEIDWDVTVIDGKATPVGWINAFNQAIALKVDGIITSADAASIQGPIKSAQDQSIPIVGIHGSAQPGPNEKLGLFTNIQQDPEEIGKAQADWVIADSSGKARVVVTSHNEFAIAEAKSRAVEARIEQCGGCEVVDYVNSPIAEVAQRQPHLVTSWVQQYGTPLYVTAVADYTLDFQVPALRSADVDRDAVKLIGADGQRSAYERIRSGEYQVVTVAEPVDMEGYQAVDELNRAFAGKEPSGFVPKPYLVTPENVDTEGGKNNAFVPSNNYKDHYLSLWGVSH